MSKKLIGIDFEYNRPMEAHMGLMAVSICAENSKPQSMWLYNDSQAKATFASWLTARKDTHIFISHNATAEAGCFLALGLNPRDFSWRDTMVEFTQVGNGYNKYQYGRSWVEHQGWVKSEPLFDSNELDDADHLFGEDREKEVEIRKAKQSAKGVSNLKVTASLLNTCKNVLGIDIGAGQKSEALALILECKAEYSQAEKDQILTYANGDTQHLIPLWLELRSIQHSRTRKPIEQIEQFAEFRGRYSANVAIYARNGIPIDIKRWENLVHNKPIVLAEEIERFQKEVAYIYEYDRKAERYKTSPNQAMAKPWVESLEKKLRVTWPTSSRGYSFSVADGSPLQDFRDIDAEVLQYCRLQELMAGLKAHATELEAIERHKQGKRTFRDAMCSQNFLHPWYKPFGTQTGRNAPAATGFVFAQAGWLRGLVNPPEGQVIIELDFGSQESWIAAVVSGDKELIHAYQSGDPYLAFAISAKAAPKDATKKSHGDVRNLFKSTVLGMSYGMGANKLAVKLSSDMGKPFSVNEAKELIRLHKEVYWRYYEWKDEVWHSYRNERTPISLPDGWYLDCHASSKMSVLNMPVQGAGSAMMRVAVDDIIGQGIKLLCPVHDSFVFMCAESEIEEQCALVTKAMIEASKLVLGVDGMRVGAPDILRHGEYWYTDKNRAGLERYKTYFEEKHNSQNKLSFIDKLLDF